MIRGYYNQEMEGNDYYVGSVELNYPIIKRCRNKFRFYTGNSKIITYLQVCNVLRSFSQIPALQDSGDSH